MTSWLEMFLLFLYFAVLPSPVLCPYVSAVIWSTHILVLNMYFQSRKLKLGIKILMLIGF